MTVLHYVWNHNAQKFAKANLQAHVIEAYLQPPTFIFIIANVQPTPLREGTNV